MLFEYVVVISLNYDQNASDRKSTFYQTVLKIQISLTEIFSKSISLALTEMLNKGAAV